MSSALPSHLLMHVFEYLSLPDFMSLLTTCKRFSHTILNHNKLWARECLSNYLSFDLELYSEIYDSEDYKSYARNKIQNLQRNSWKLLIEEGEICRKSFVSSLCQLAPVEDAQNFVEYFYETLKQPTLPVANLKRETLTCTTQTIFQAKLAEVLYEETGMISKNRTFFNPNRSLIDGLQQIEKKLFEEMNSHDRDEIIKARWYNFEKKEFSDNDETISFEEKSDMFIESLGLPDLTKISNASTDDLMMVKTRNTLLMDLYENLFCSVVHYCGILHRYLTSLDDIYLVVSEYTARWKAYVCSMLELEKTFTTFTELLNTHYEAIFEGYPSFPKFSIWRLMTKIWMREVYEKSNLGMCLNESFLKLFNCHREINVKKSFNSNFSNTGMNEEIITELPKSLYVDLTMKEKQQNYEQNSDFSNDSFSTNFKTDSESEKDLLSSFIQSVQDISFNEVNIHYTDCTDMPSNYPYCELEDAIIKQSNVFYKEYQQLFNEAPEYFCQFLKCDSSLLGRILGNRTNVKLAKIQNQSGFQILKDFIGNKIENIDQEETLKNEKQQIFGKEQRGEVNEFIESFIEQVIEAKNDCLAQADENKSNTMEEEYTSNNYKFSPNKSMIKLIATALENDSPNLRSSLEFFCLRLKEMQSLSDKDNIIKQANIDNNIPCELSDIDSLFYDLDKNLNMTLLGKLYEDYLVFQKQQEQSEGKTPEISPLTHPPYEFDLGNMENGINFEQDFLEEDNLDFLNLGEPTLRRAMY
jgi:hypothetical protein